MHDSYLNELTRLELQVTGYHLEHLHWLETHDAADALEAPEFLSTSQVLKLESIVGTLLHALRKIPNDFFHGDLEHALEFLDLIQFHKPWLSDYFGKSQLPLARPDTIFKEDDIKILEFNSSSALNSSPVEALATYFLNHPVTKSLFSGKPLQPLSFFSALDSYFKSLGWDKKSILILTNEKDTSQKPPTPLLDYLLNQNYDVQLSSFQHMNQKRPVDVIFRTFNTGSFFMSQELREVEQAVIAKDTVLFHDLTEIVTFDKQCMAILSDPQYNGFLSKLERDLCSKHLPWTRRLKDVSDKVLHDDQLNLVIKGGQGALARQVFIGKHWNRDAWRSLVQEARAFGGCIVQAIEDVPLQNSARIVNNKLKFVNGRTIHSPYFVNDKLSGILVRYELDCRPSDTSGLTLDSVETTALIYDNEEPHDPS